MSAEIERGKKSELEDASMSRPMDVDSDSIEPEIEPLTGKPFAHLVIAKTHVKPTYQLVVPAKLSRLLPSASVPVELIRGGKTWGATYEGEHKTHKKLDSRWKTFVVDNKIEVGDACVFELLESSSKLIKFKVQILRGKFPDELQGRVNGETIDSPIIIGD